MKNFKPNQVSSAARNVGGNAHMTSRLVRQGPRPMALEQRFMFDGAALVDAVDTLDHSTPDAALLTTGEVMNEPLLVVDSAPAVVQISAVEAETLVKDYLASHTDAELFALFNGGQTDMDAAWASRLDSLRSALAGGSLHLNVVVMDNASQFTAVAAFGAEGPNGEPTIFINPYWFGMFDAPDATRALVEEIGHAIDHYLNPNSDTTGDEGKAFANMVMDGVTISETHTTLTTQGDQGTVTVGGVSYQVEFASFRFVNAYEMVYDQNGNNLIDTTERWADKEQNLHYFNASQALGAVSITDGTNDQNFSGNDVSATAIVINGTTYYGWISRPIKSGGIVRGFYFWTDANFTSLSAAQLDGNQDKDSNVLDNRGFLLVVDQAWFNAQITATGSTQTISSTKDGNLGTVTVANVGSSSDRVDSALNSLFVNDLLAVSNVTVNEGSPYAVFTASGAANQVVTLELGNQNDDGHDLTTIQYFNGSSWVTYTGGTVFLDGSGKLLVRVEIAPEQEATLDGPETFNLVVKNSSGLAGTGGTGTIVDDGTGSYFATNNNTATSSLPTGTFLDDDRPLAVNSVTVNEGSPYAVFEVTGAAYQLATLSLTNGDGVGGTPDTAGLNTLQYYNGTSWVPYSSGSVALNGSGKLYVRVALNPEQETVLDTGEKFTLSATNTGGATAQGTGTVMDDGTGSYFLNNGTTAASNSELSNAGIRLDDDRPLTITSPTVNEASPYAVFRVNGQLGQLVTLNLTPGTASSTLDYQAKVEYSVDGGTTWITYTGGTVSLNGAGGTLLVRVPIVNDSIEEPDETFTLTASNTGGGAVVGTATITDDGNGIIYNADGTINDTAVKDDDRPLTVNNVTANEADGTMTFTVTGVSGQLVKLQLQSTGSGAGSATLSGADADMGTALEYYDPTANAGAGGWVSYSPAEYVAIPVGSTTLQVRVAINRDALVESSETFYLAATNTGGGTARGTGTITDLLPAATAVTTTALEAGGTLNGTPGTDPSGDLAASGYTLYSASFGTAAAVTTPASGNTTVTGAYGTLTMSRDGTWSYAVNNDNLAVQALRTTTNTLTETFTYTVEDAYGARSPNTLTITIQGANDAPVANSDYNVAKESLAGTAGFVGVTAYSTTADATYDRVGYVATGNVLPNDTDVDAGDSKTITGLTATGSATGTSSGTTAGTTTLSFTTLPSNISKGYYVWIADQDGIPDSDRSTSALLTSGGPDKYVTVLSIDTTAKTFTLSGAVDGTFTLSANTILGFSNGTNGSAYKEATISNATTTATSTVNLTGISGNIGLGMTVSDGGSLSATVLQVNYDNNGNPISVVISSTAFLSGATLTFSGTVATGATLSGAYGTLLLNADGSYSYTPYANNANLSEGQSATDVFTYTMEDTAGLQSTSTLTITVLGSGSNDPDAKDDTNFVIEAGGATTVTSATGNVLNDATHGSYADIADTTPSGTLAVTGIKVPSASSFSNVNTTVHGLYGSITISSTGGYTYTLNQDNALVQALTSGQTLTEQFQYEVQNGNTTTVNGQTVYLKDVATLTITILGTNDAPVLDLDPSNSGSLNYANTFTEGGLPVSLLLQSGINLSDVDSSTFDNLILSFTQSTFPDGSAERLLVSGATVGGTLTLGGLADGTDSTGTLTLGGVVYDFTRVVGSGTVTFTFTKDGGAELSTAETEALLDALRYENTSENPTAGSNRVFTLKVTDGAGLASVPVTSTITVVPVNDAPTLDLDGNNSSTATGADYLGSFRVGGSASAIVDTDVGIADMDSVHLTSATITLTNAKTGDTLSFNGTLPSNIDIAGLTMATADGPLVVALTTKLGQTATKADYEAALKAIRFAATGTDYTDRVFTVSVADDSSPAPLASNTAIATLTVLPDNRPLTVMGTTVNEASPYVLFTVGGATGQRVTLELGTTGTGTGHAVLGADTTDANTTTHRALQYLVGTTWTDYEPGTTVTLTGTTLLVRTAVVNDSQYEGDETLRLIARNDAGVANDTTGSNPDGKSHIVDDGTGGYFAANNTSGASNTEGVTLDDDRPLTVSDVTVNEGSPWAVFTVTGANGQAVMLSLANASGSGSPDAIRGPADLGSTPRIEYLLGSTWTTYDPASPPTIASGTTLLVRVDIRHERDTALDGPETFNLLATNTGGTAGTGTGTIVDDGSGSYFDDDNTSTTSSLPAGTYLDDDRPVTVTSTTVNEASPFAVFTVSGAPGQLVGLTLGESGNATLDTDYVNQLEYSVDGGLTWSTYTSGFVALDGPDGTMLVRVPIVDDNALEVSETFSLKATNTGGTSATGTGTITDEGNGTLYNANGTVNTLAVKDDDRPITVVGGNYNENAASAVFTVNANLGQLLTFDVRDVAAPGKARTGGNEGKPDDSLDNAPLFYSLNNGATWLRYNGTAIEAGNLPVLVAVDVTNERDDVFEGEQSFQLVVTPGAKQAVGYSSLFDDGTGTLTDPIDENTTHYRGGDNGQRKDDDRSVAQTPPTIPQAPTTAPAPAPVVTDIPPEPLPPFNLATVMQVNSPTPQLEIGTFPAEAILTSDIGFPVLVAEPGNPALPPNLTLANGLNDQFADPGIESRFAIPYDTFAHTKADAQITLIAKLQDGSELPSWVVFDPQSGTFTVNPPADLPPDQRELKLMVIARDQEGREAVAPFRFFVGDDKAKPKVAGRLSLTEQLKLAGKRGQTPWADWGRAPVEAKPVARAPAAERAAAQAG